MQEGIINQIIGPVIDIKFEEGHMPELLNAILIQDGDKKSWQRLHSISEMMS